MTVEYSSLTTEQLSALFEEMRNPPVHPMCSQMRLMDFGNRFIQPFTYSTREIRPISAIGVYRVSFSPDKAEDLDALHNHVINAVQKLSKIECEFESPHPSPETHEGEYIRPKLRQIYAE